MTTTSECTDRCTGEVFPEGLADVPPGPVLAEVLGRWMPRLATLPHVQAGQLLAAQARQANHTDAVTLAFAWDIACRFHDPDDLCAHATEPGRGAVALVALLCGWSEPVARARLELARAVLVRFPQLHAAMLAGRLDTAAARASATATRDYPDDLARHVVSTVFGDGSPKTAAEIEDEILRTATGADPALIEALAKAAVSRRRLSTQRNRDGSVNLNARNLPVDYAASVMGGINGLVQAARHDGDPRTLGQLHVEVLHGLASRSWGMLTDEEILDQLRATRPAPGPEGTGEPGPSDLDPSGGPDPSDRGGPGPGAASDDQADAADSVIGEEEPDVDDGRCSCDTAGPFARSPVALIHHPGHGLDVRVELSTLLGDDEHPARLGRYGAITATLARDLARAHSAGLWRYTIVDADGHLLTAGLVRKRPRHWAKREARYRSSIDLIIPVDLLEAMRAGLPLDPAWAAVLGEIDADLQRPPADPTRRFADARLRRKILARFPTCIWPGCREPALSSEVDHAHEHAHGGPTDEANQWPLCPRHHALKTNHGWTTTITGPRTYTLTGPLGTTHAVQLPPAWPRAPEPWDHWSRWLRPLLLKA